MKDGVQDEVLQQGVHFINPLHKVNEFPVSQQQLVLSNNPADYNSDKHADWHVDAPANGGMVKLNLTINYKFLAEKVTGLYDRFRGMDGDTLVENMVQNSIIAYIKEVTPQFTVMDIYSTKRAEVGQAITDYLNTKLNDEYGIDVVSRKLIPLFDIADGQFIVYDLKDGTWGILHIDDKEPYSKKKTLLEVLKASGF
jgi:hypothetical protein